MKSQLSRHVRPFLLSKIIRKFLVTIEILGVGGGGRGRVTKTILKNKRTIPTPALQRRNS
jgi:hypothetical protein